MFDENFDLTNGRYAGWPTHPGPEALEITRGFSATINWFPIWKSARCSNRYIFSPLPSQGVYIVLNGRYAYVGIAFGRRRLAARLYEHRVCANRLGIRLKAWVGEVDGRVNESRLRNIEHTLIRNIQIRGIAVSTNTLPRNPFQVSTGGIKVTNRGCRPKFRHADIIARNIKIGGRRMYEFDAGVIQEW